MNARVSRMGVLCAAVLVSCASDESPAPATAPPDPPRAVVASSAHHDLGGPSFVWISGMTEKAPTAREAAAATRQAIAPAYGLSPAILQTLAPFEIDDAGGGPVIARAAQRIDGIEVFRGGITLAMTRTLEPVAASGIVARSLDRPRVGKGARLDEAAALRLAATRLDGEAPLLSSVESRGEVSRFAASTFSQPARVKRVFFPMLTGVVDAYYIEIESTRGRAWSFVLAADDGRELFRNDLVNEDAFDYRVWANGATRLPLDGPQGDALAPHPSGKPDGLRPLSFVPMQRVRLESYPFSKNDPWLAPGATRTLGNNVRAYADLVAPDGLQEANGDVVGAVSASGAFDWTYDTSLPAGATTANIQASITQLFYVTNFLHDWYYDVGFDEKAGNHQLSNFGRGGKENDPLRAETLDYSGRNNANASTPADGSSPRIQMFVYDGRVASALSVETPFALAGNKATGTASFGPDVFDVGGPVVLANPPEACGALAGSFAGKIVLVRRGGCTFVEKAEAAQAAGAIGVVIANVASSPSPNTPPSMPGPGDATVPVLSLALADGGALEAAAVLGNVNARLVRRPRVDVDGTFDTTIAAHEWGHVLSNRLIGNANGLRTNQSRGLGEGWGDFEALILATRAGQPGNFGGVYTHGPYTRDFYYGSRRVPYSVDFTKNPLTFKHVQNGTPLPQTAPIRTGADGASNAEVHNTGEVWATMLWECYVALLRSGRLPFAEAQKRMRRYLVASLKLTPVDPTLLEARDAMLAVALATDEADYRDFWAAFARRGAGIGAFGPPKESTTNQGVTESAYAGNDVRILDATIDDDVITCDRDGVLDPGETGSVTVTVRNEGSSRLEGASVSFALPPGWVARASEGKRALPVMRPLETRVLTLPISMTRGRPNERFDVRVTVTAPTLPADRVKSVVVPARYAADEAESARAIDDVETRGTSWAASKASRPWSRTHTTEGSWWSVPDLAEVADRHLTTKPFAVAGKTFSLAFKHRFSFRPNDGGVVEISTDGGTTWQDASEVGKIDYGATLAAGDNPLAERSVYGGASPAHPAWVNGRADFQLDAPAPDVRLRLRVGTGTSTSAGAVAPAWDIDDIELVGIADRPFYGFAPHADACDAKGPTVDPGGPYAFRSRTTATLTPKGTHPKALPLSFVWTQTAGPEVQGENEDGRLSFTTPDVASPLVLGFTLRAHDGHWLSPARDVDVTITPADAVPPAASAPDVPRRFAAGGAGCTFGAAEGPPLPVPLGVLALLGVWTWRRRRWLGIRCLCK